MEKLYKNRRDLRGETLDSDCRRCRTIRESAKDRDGVVHTATFCYGMIDLRTDEKADCCSACTAHTDYVDAWFEEVQQYTGT